MVSSLWRLAPYVAIAVEVWYGASAQSPIWLTSIQPFTGADWDAGISMRHGGLIMLEEINSNPSILPGYDLKIAWQDGLCSKGVGKHLFLKNIFDKEYTVFAPNSTDSELDVDGDGVITTADTAPLGKVWNQTEVSPDPIGLLGSGCAGTAMQIVTIAYTARFPMVSNSATRPALSDRSTYPNFFRTILPDTFFNGAWISVAKALGMSTVTTVIGESENWASMGQVLAGAAALQGITLQGDDLSEAIGTGYRGMQVPLDDKSMAKSAANGLAKYRQRVVVLLMFHRRNRLVMCEAAKLGFKNAVYMAFGWLPFGWWSFTDTDCTSGQMVEQAVGMVTANMQLFRNDDSTRLSCSTSMTAAQFKTEWFSRQGAAEGDLAMRPEGYAPALEAATTADAVCMYATALHQLLINESMPLSELTTRTKTGYNRIIDKFSSIDFEGVQGRVRFLPGKADPEGSIILQQLKQATDGTLSFLDLATYKAPDMTFLGKGDFVFQFANETFPAGPAGSSTISGSLTQYEVCPQMTDFATNQCIDCPTNMEFVQFAGTCLCVAGYFASSSGCSPCAGGTFSKAAGTVVCDICQTGTYAPTGSTSCTFCPRGTYADADNMAECTSCPSQHTTLNIAADSVAECVCDIGAYQQTGGFACISCAANATTVGVASTSAASCMCPGDTYMSADASECTPCPEGSATSGNGKAHVRECLCDRGLYMPLDEEACRECPEGSQCPKGTGADGHHLHPLAAVGFMVLQGDLVQVYKCLNSEACPGGVAGTCAEFRDTTAPACGTCADGAYMAGGTCRKCREGGVDAAPIILAIIAGIVALFVVTYAVNRNLMMQSNSTLLCITMVALMFTGLQTLGIFQQVSIPWFEPLGKILELTSVFSFDLRVLKMTCIFGTNPVVNFGMRQLVAPMVIPFVFCALLLKKWKQPNVRLLPELSNTVGTLFNVLFISIMLSGVSPLICYRHPPFTADAEKSMMSDPAVLCDRPGKHGSMVALGMVAIFVVPLPFLVAACIATWKYPTMITSGSPWLHAVRFLFFRLNANRYYFGVFLLFRSLFICLIPVLPGLAGDVALQTWVMAAMIGSFTLVQQQLNHWRSYLANIFDGVISICLLLLLITGVMITDLHASIDSIRVVGMLSFFSFILVIVGAISWGVYNRLVPRPFWQYFICHHKLQAAAQARVLKLLIQNKTRADVFIDSDNLQELDTLFDIVKTKLGNLVVYLTRETLTRPWCAGEICTAVNAPRVKTTVVRTKSFIPPTLDELNDLSTFLDLTGCNLAEYNMPLSAVREALVNLLAQGFLELSPTETGSRLFDDLSCQIVLTNSSMAQSTSIKTQVTRSTVVISSLPNCDESTASACILNTKIQKEVLNIVESKPFLLTDHGEDIGSIVTATAKCQAGIIVLSAGTLESAPQLAAIAELMATVAAVDTSVPGVIPVNTPGFNFPDPSYYKMILPRHWPDFNYAEASPHIHSFFKRIAVTLNTSASDQALDTVMDAVISRIPTTFDRKLALARTPMLDMFEVGAEADGQMLTVSTRL